MKLVKIYWSHALIVLFNSVLFVLNAFFIFHSSNLWYSAWHSVATIMLGFCLYWNFRSIQRERDYQAELASFLKKYDFSKPILIYDGKYPPNRSTHPITDTKETK